MAVARPDGAPVDGSRAATPSSWAVAIAFVAVTGLLWWQGGLSAHFHQSRYHLALPVFVVVVAAAESLAVQFEFRTHLFSAHFAEVAVVLALAFCSPTTTLIGAIVGSVAAVALLGIRRDRFVGNTALGVVQFGVARVVFGALAPPQSLLSPAGWIAGLTAVLAGSAASFTGVVIAVRVSKGPGAAWSVVRPIGVSLVVALSNGALGLLAAILIIDQRWAAVLLAVVVVVFALGYRGYTTLRQRYANLNLLYAFTSALTDTASGEAVLKTVLEQSRALMNGAYVSLTVPVPKGYIRACLDEAGEVVETMMQDPDRLVGEVLSSPDGVVHTRPKRGNSATFDALGLRDVIGVPVAISDDVTGALIVGDRPTDVKSFENEDLRLLTALAAHASIALRNGQLVDQLTEEAATRAYQALHDALTRLGNRTLFVERLKAALESAGELMVAVMLMDLDAFKEINDTLGHATGDSVLREVADRLRKVVGLRGTVARLGGDEFAVAIPGCQTADEAFSIARVIHELFDQPVEVEGLSLEVRASMGVTLSPDHGTDPNVLLQRADVAMYSAKEARRGVEIYAPDRDHYSPRRLSLASDLRHDLDARRLEIHFQPKVDMATGRVVGFEALSRWAHREHGNIPPDEFIAIAEQSGLIARLTHWVLDSALTAAARWRSLGYDISIAVNLSARSLLDLALLNEIRDALRRSGLPASALVLELTETSVMADLGRSRDVLAQLSALGCRLAIDDFGTGYSSLTRLKQLPVDEIKIDKSFVLHMASDEDDGAIVRSIIDLARNMGLIAVAEGVEDAETWETLRDLGCAQVQGYFFSKPKPMAEIEDWLSVQNVDRLPALIQKAPVPIAAPANA